MGCTSVHIFLPSKQQREMLCYTFLQIKWADSTLFNTMDNACLLLFQLTALCWNAKASRVFRQNNQQTKKLVTQQQQKNTNLNPTFKCYSSMTHLVLANTKNTTAQNNVLNIINALKNLHKLFSKSMKDVNSSL